MTLKKAFFVNIDCGAAAAILQANPSKKSFIKLKQGSYKVTLHIKKSWNRPVSNFGYIAVKPESPFLVIGDLSILGESENVEEKLHEKGTFVSSGGDGRFKVHVTVQKVKRIGADPFKKLKKEAAAFIKGKEYSEELAEEFNKRYVHGRYYERISNMLTKLRHRKLNKILAEIAAYYKE